MHRRLLGSTLVAISSILVSWLGATSPAGATTDDATAGPPTQLDCLPLLAGTTGLLVAGDLPTLSSLIGNGGWGQPAPPALNLPDRVTFKDDHHTISTRYAFALRDGNLYAAEATNGDVTPGEQWRQLHLPSCLANKITAISADHGLLVAVTPDGQVYSHNMPRGDLSPERWTWRWGPYLWTGLGAKLPNDVVTAAVSDFSAPSTFRDTAGRVHEPIGVATYYLLRDAGRRITYLDPWLPADQSREVCLPNAGSTRLAGMDASGSTILAASRDGEIYTRLYDFDTSGANTLFGSFTWQEGLPADTAEWQLPAEGWTQHAQPPGTITDRVSIVSTGTGPDDRELRVEGQDDAGNNGVWTKPIAARDWTFTRSNAALTGTALPVEGASVARDTRRYLGTMGGATASIDEFDWACTPATVHVDVAENASLTLQLYAYDGMRQAPRAAGLDDHPREYNAALIVPADTWATLPEADERVQRWVEQNLDGRITVSPISVTATRLRFLAPCWDLTLDGQPARADALPLPLPDAGVLLGRLTEMAKDGRTPGSCFLGSLPLG